MTDVSKNEPIVKARCAETIHRFSVSKAPWLQQYLTDDQEFFVLPVTEESFDDDDELQRYYQTNPDDRTYKIRLPLNPKIPDKPLGYDLTTFAERLGASGWDYVNQLSIWGGVDYDAKGDAHEKGCTEDELKGIWDAAVRAGCFTMVLSRSNRFAETDAPWKGGFHLYLLLRKPLAAPTRQQHKDNVLAAFETVGREVGTDFLEKADQKGAILYFYHWKQRPGTLEPVNKPTREAPDVEPSRVTPSRHDSARPEDAPELSAAQRDCLEYLLSHGASYYPDEGGRVNVYTPVLKKYLDERKLTGSFDTFSTGKDGTKPNAHMYFLPDGATARVYRWGDDRGKPSMEPTWGVPDEGKMPYAKIRLVHTFESACLAAVALRNSCGFTASYRQAKLALDLLGLELPALPDDRSVTLTMQNNHILVQTDRIAREELEGWAYKSPRARTLESVLDLPDHLLDNKSDTQMDDDVRFVVTPDGDQVGWLRKLDGESWGAITRTDLLSMIVSRRSIKKSDAELMLGEATATPWYLVVEPFKEEYLPDRRWNRNAPRLAFQPTTGSRPLVYTHWDMINEHLGKGLNDAAANDPWCNKHGIKTGAQYLFAWQASLFQNPKQKLPYLHFFSEPKVGKRHQNAGKSTLHRALSLLMTKGTANVHQALSEKFNQQLEGAILGFVDEKQLNQDAYLRLKEILDAPTVTIRAMRQNAYQVPNHIHIVHASNNKSYVPVESGDERVIVIEVEAIPKDQIIPWDDAGGHVGLESKLKAEGPDYLAALLQYELPPSSGRLHLPVLGTAAKEEVMKSTLKREMKERGELLTLPEVIDVFMGDDKKLEMSSTDLIKRLPIGDFPEKANPFTRELKRVRHDLDQDHGIKFTPENERPGRRGGHLFERK